MVNSFNQFLKTNNINKEEVESLVFSCFINSLFEELVKHIERNNLEITVKTRLRDSYNLKEEIYIISSLIEQFSTLSLSDDYVNVLLINLKAYFSKSNNRIRLSNSKKEAILKLQTYKCKYCFGPLSLDTAHFDHLLAFKWVGDEIDDNYQGLCVSCNLEKGTNPFFPLKSLLLKTRRT